jgi:hypothetical protein
MICRYLNHISITLYFLKAITGSDIYLILASSIGMVLFLFQLNELKSFKIEKIVFYLFLAVALSFVHTLINNGLTAGKLFVPLFLANIALARSIVKYGISFNFSQILFYGVSLYFVIAILIGYSVDDIFANSRNHVSILFINSAAIFYIANYQKNNKRYFLPVILVVVFSVISQGIAGILCSLGFLFLVYYYYYFQGVNYFLFKLILSSGLLFLLALIFDRNVLNFFIWSSLLGDDLIYKLSSFEFSTLQARQEIWGDYFNKLNWQRVFLGVNLKEKFFDYSNLHSSYLLMHARGGWAALIFIFIFALSLLRMYQFNFILFSCYLVILIRGITDTSFLSGSSFDFILLTLIIISYINQKKVKLYNDD